DAESSDSFAVAPPADEGAAADSESVAAAPRGASGSVAAAIANSAAEDADSEESAAASGAGEASESEPESGGSEADEVDVVDTAENTVDAVADPDIDDVGDSTVVPPQDDAPEAAQAEDEEFVNEEEAEVPVRRVPASFAARGATSEDADSTGHESQPAKPKDAPRLGHTWSEPTQNHGSDRGTFGEQLSDRSDTSLDDAAARPDEPSGRAGEVSTSASGSVFDDLLGTERKRNRMKKRKKD